jgi:hypothetical protein
MYKIPGANSIRAISRFSFVALIIFSVLLANFIEYLKNINLKDNTKMILINFVLILFLLEHIPAKITSQSLWVSYGWSKKEFVSDIKTSLASIDNDCEVVNVVFYDNSFETYKELGYAGVEVALSQEVLAMWLTAYSNIYTSMGMTGIVLHKKIFKDDVKYCKVYLNKDFTEFMR